MNPQLLKANHYLCIMSSLLKNMAIFPIRMYQWMLSPLLGNNCRHAPTCSQYTIEAIGEWGVGKGVWMGAKRIAKCHPWGTHGYDPVPKKPINP
jgi:putative membrane protein insertion efficiency factor